ncbi:MAG: MFS transporter [Ilumatobacteraceae bacterium]
MIRGRVLALLPGSVIGAALVVRLFDEWWSYLPAGIVDDLHRDLGVSYAGAGWLLSLLTLGALVGSPLALMADHVDRRLCAVGGAVVIAACLAAYALGAPFWVLVIATSLLGTASDLLVESIEASLSELPEERLDRVLGRQHALSSVGDLLGPALLALGASTPLGWRGAFASTAAAMLAYALYLATVPFPAPQDAAGSMREIVAEAIVIGRRRDVRRLAVLEMLISPLDEPLLAFVVARAAAGGRAEGIAQILAVAVMVGGLGGSLLVGRIGISERTRRIGPLVLLAGTVVSVAMPSVVAGTLGMVGVGGGMAIVWADVHLRSLTVVPGRAATVSTVIGTIGSAAAFAPVLSGTLADRGGLTAGLTVYVVVAAAIVFVVRGVEPMS